MKVFHILSTALVVLTLQGCMNGSLNGFSGFACTDQYGRPCLRVRSDLWVSEPRCKNAEGIYSKWNCQSEANRAVAERYEDMRRLVERSASDAFNNAERSVQHDPISNRTVISGSVNCSSYKAPEERRACVSGLQRGKENATYQREQLREEKQRALAGAVREDVRSR